MNRLATAALALALVTVACASTGEPRPRTDPNVISSEEIERASASNAYDLVQSLRPRWLQTRGQHSLRTRTEQTQDGPVDVMETSEVAVYLDGVRLGGRSALRQVPAQNLGSLQRLGPADATQRFGTGHPAGAILLNSRRP